jgi:hemoglobin-like flavoprotein
MTPAQIKLVQDSFAKVAPIAGEVAEFFYDRLFTIAPGVRPLFAEDLTTQKQKLMQMLGTVIANLHQVETIIPAVQELGKRHVGYGVTTKHYDSVGAALLWTLDRLLASEFTPAVKEAWTAAYATLAKVMNEAAATVAPASGKPAAA